MNSPRSKQHICKPLIGTAYMVFPYFPVNVFFNIIFI